jgi:hypothetical protein
VSVKIVQGQAQGRVEPLAAFVWQPEQPAIQHGCALYGRFCCGLIVRTNRELTLTESSREAAVRSHYPMSPPSIPPPASPPPTPTSFCFCQS